MRRVLRHSIRQSLREQFRVTPQVHKGDQVSPRLFINHQKITADMALSETVPIPGKRMVSILGG
jgi:hypothetical protein